MRRFQGPLRHHMCAARVRRDFRSAKYSWELWDNSNNDQAPQFLDAVKLRMDSVRALEQKTLMRDVLTFGTMRKLRTDYMAARTKFASLIYNQTAGRRRYKTNGYKGVYAIKEKLKIGQIASILPSSNSLVTQAVAECHKAAIFSARQGRSRQTQRSETRGFRPGLSFDAICRQYSAAKSSRSKTSATSSRQRSMPRVLRIRHDGYAGDWRTDTFIDAQGLWSGRSRRWHVFSTYVHKDPNGGCSAGPIWDFNISIGKRGLRDRRSPTGWLTTQRGHGLRVRETNVVSTFATRIRVSAAAL